MTKAAAEGGPRPAIDGNLVLIWVDPEVIAFAFPGGKKSLLALVRASATLVRCTAEMRRDESGAKRLSKQAIRECAADLFVRAAEQMPLMNLAQKRIADVVVQIADANVDVFLSPMLVRAELERAAVFVLRSAYAGCRQAHVVLSATEFQTWLEQLACETYSRPLTREDQAP